MAADTRDSRDPECSTPKDPFIRARPPGRLSPGGAYTTQGRRERKGAERPMPPWVTNDGVAPRPVGRGRSVLPRASAAGVEDAARPSVKVQDGAGRLGEKGYLFVLDIVKYIPKKMWQDFQTKSPLGIWSPKLKVEPVSMLVHIAAALVELVENCHRDWSFTRQKEQ